MTTFTVWKFDTVDGAKHAAKQLRGAQTDGLVTIVDHAVASWPEGKSRPDVDHHHDDTTRGAGWGALWGLLGGALFMVPVVGVAAGAAIGALAKATQDAGITKDQLQTIRTELTEGTSALFLVTENADFDRLGERMRGLHSTLLTTNLTDAERETLLETFGGG
jgi:uncharacterized membrane protein